MMTWQARHSVARSGFDSRGFAGEADQRWSGHERGADRQAALGERWNGSAGSVPLGSTWSVRGKARQVTHRWAALG